MAKTIDARLVQSILYALFKALHNIAGSSAPALMRKAGPDMLSKIADLGVDFSCVDDISKLESKIGETMVNTGMCDEMKFRLDGNVLTANITNCSFFDLTSQLKEEGIEPFGCPFAGLTIAVAEKNLGKRARLKQLQPTPGGKPGDTMIVVELHEK